ncbi:NRDE-2, necessary for RNA interference domain-containing protein [Ditylenchus destructor]|uniref:NRDE-2, necessary for RNA interference domain-containing protein n=1 Tax=Ditylenchus destructor TaxID=166010 RepID=A0AAD4R4E1_9BILA|nr:NRDE-2, necessary for RNA interference domain-containing protein [Ditylenchus destructor]
MSHHRDRYYRGRRDSPPDVQNVPSGSGQHYRQRDNRQQNYPPPMQMYDERAGGQPGIIIAPPGTVVLQQMAPGYGPPQAMYSGAAIPAYGQFDNRAVPPELSTNGFGQMTQEQTLKATYEARKKEEEAKKLRKQNAMFKKQLQDMSRYSIKQTTLDSGDDSDVPAMGWHAEPQFDNQDVILDRSPSPERHSRRHRDGDRHKKRKRKHKNRSSSSDSGSSSGSSVRKSRKRKEHKKKHHSSKRRKRSPSPSSQSSENSEPSPRKVMSEKEISGYDVRKNKYKLLRKQEWTYMNNLHMIIDYIGDHNNLVYEESYKHLVPDHFPPRIIYVPYDHVKPFEPGSSNIKRYSDPSIMKNWNKKLVERRFRRLRLPAIKEPLSEPIAISHQPCGADEVTQVKEEEEIVLPDMTIDAYAAVKETKDLSIEEADLDQMRKILYARCHTNHKDVESWIKYIDIQNKLMAKEESNDPENEVKNTKALYQKKEAILNDAVKYNPANVDLALKKIEIDQEYYGVNSLDVQSGLNRAVNKFCNSIKMWSMYIQMRQNDRSSFTLSDTISIIDKCIRNLVDIRDGVKVSHKAEPGTDAFLLDLVVHRTKLLIESDYISWAIASVQAIAEFHFFDIAMSPEMKPKDYIPMKCSTFKNFWETGVPRIGDDFAMGWRKSNYNERFIDKEQEQLLAQVARINKREDLIQQEHQKFGMPNIDVWRRVDILRTEETWRPVRYSGQDENHIQYLNRVIKFEQIKPILFHLSDKKLACDLVFRLLQLFGAVIPGMEFVNQESTLRRFSSSDLPNFSLEYRDIRKFMDNFFDLFANADGVDSIRTRTAKLITFLEMKQVNYWEIENRIERLVYLNMALDICRRLPFDSSGTIVEDWPKELKGLTKKKVLVCIGISGTVGQVDVTPEIVNMAKTNWIKHLKMLDPCVKEAAEDYQISELSWLGNEAEITLELGALFTYETSPVYEAPSVLEYVISKSNLGRRLSNKAFVYAMKVNVYEHHIQRLPCFGKQKLRELLDDAIIKFPEKVEFIKKYLELKRNIFEKRIFLKKLPDCAGKSKLVRSAAKIFLEWDYYSKHPENSHALMLLRQALEDSAREEASNGYPDAYFWCFLMYIEAQIARGSVKRMDEASLLYVFTLGQKLCPWSKTFIFESTKGRSNSEEYLSVAYNSIITAGLNLLCIPNEVSEILRPNAEIDQQEMAHNFEGSIDFGDNRPLVTGFRSLRHPSIVLVHLMFRALGVVFYVFANILSSSFIIQLLVLLSLFSADFWTVKNITGRFLVGLRWWSFVDAEGNNHFKFETSKDPQSFDAMERRIFWGALVVAPIFWLLLVSVAFFTFQWQWMIVCLLGLSMTSTNLYMYLRCKWSNTNELTNYLTKWAFLSMLTRNFQTQQAAATSLETV